MHRVIALVALVVLVAFGALPSLARTHAAAHDVTYPTADSPLVGAWWWRTSQMIRLTIRLGSARGWHVCRGNKLYRRGHRFLGSYGRAVS